MTDTLQLRFSASYASRYHNCHASANLEKAIPGFTVEKSEKAKARDEGTQYHSVVARILETATDLLAAADVLWKLADVYGKNRDAIIRSAKEYITWWFLTYGTEPPLDYDIIKDLEHEGKSTPRAIRFLAESIEYTAALVKGADEVLVEESIRAAWLSTAPRTTVDILIRRGNVLHVLDLKTGQTPVDAFNNEQLMYYARSFLKDETEIHLHIMQRNNFSSWQIDRRSLLAWADQVKESERAILSGDVTFAAGSHCNFCPANPTSRGEKGSPSCPTRLEILYGVINTGSDDEAILED